MNVALYLGPEDKRLGLHECNLLQEIAWGFITKTKQLNDN